MNMSETTLWSTDKDEIIQAMREAIADPTQDDEALWLSVVELAKRPLGDFTQEERQIFREYENIPDEDSLP